MVKAPTVFNQKRCLRFAILETRNIQAALSLPNAVKRQLLESIYARDTRFLSARRGRTEELSAEPRLTTLTSTTKMVTRSRTLSNGRHAIIDAHGCRRGDPTRMCPGYCSRATLHCNSICVQEEANCRNQSAAQARGTWTDHIHG
jgi:hypothetical protein